MTTAIPTSAYSPAEAVAERIMAASLSFIDVLAIYLGDRLGWYAALAHGGPATAAELVTRAGGAERYAQEWLEQQAAAGILAVAEDGRFILPPGAAEILTDPESLSYLAPIARMFGAAATQLPALVDAYRTGSGVSWAQFGADMREGQADANRPWFLHKLPEVLASVPEIHHVLSRDGAQIADVGCGAGWSTIALAQAYPTASVHGWDVDQPSIDLARRHAADAGLAHPPSFATESASRLPQSAFDAIFAFECVHDMPRPVEVLTAMRHALRPTGIAVVMDEAVNRSFEAPASNLDRFMYGCSLLICLPDGMSSQPTAGTGTVMRPDTLQAYAQQAGFAGIDVLPTGEFGLWRFYRLLTGPDRIGRTMRIVTGALHRPHSTDHPEPHQVNVPG